MKRFFALIFIYIMMTGLFLTPFYVSAEPAEFYGGTGTAQNPYLIANKQHLNNVRGYPDAHFLMMENIAFTAEDFAAGGDFYNGGAGWQPIGTDESASFAGVFDGGGHTIAGLHINIVSSADNVYAGLFGYSTGTIRNVGMVSAAHGPVNLIKAVSTVSSMPMYPSGVYAGSIVGYGDVVNCFSAVNVTAASSAVPAYAGGLTGCGNISLCFNTGSVNVSSSSAPSRAGGLTGMGNAENSYNTGGVAATSSGSYPSPCAGGIAGYLISAANCYNTGRITASSYAPGAFPYAGGIAGTGSTVNNTINCYDIEGSTFGVATGMDAGITCTSEEMGRQSTFAGFDFDAVWEILGSRPQLSANRQTVVSSITLVSLPSNLMIIKDAPLDLTGGWVNFIRKDISGQGIGESSIMTPDMLSGFDCHTPGTQKVYITRGGKTSEDYFTVTVLPAPMAANGYLSEVLPETTVSALLTGFDGEITPRIFNGHIEITGKTKLCTGLTVFLMRESSIVQTLTLVVKGDVTGEGAPGLKGLVKMKRDITRAEALQGAFLQAADVDGDGSVTSVDLAGVKKDLLDIEKLK